MALQLEKHLVLNRYFLSLFGFDDFNKLANKLKDISEGYDNSTGKSHFFYILNGLIKKQEDLNLEKYDKAIREYVETLKEERNSGFELKYFQYLAVLFSEIFLDEYFNKRKEFLNKLNEFLKKFNNKNTTDISSFEEDDLKKLAFWMATGSGKTLIMHINYWQILKYLIDDKNKTDDDKKKIKWDNILLITPNEGLSKQHYEELKLSGIPCKLYDRNNDDINTKTEQILIIDIHKLTTNKEGDGVSLDISSFGKKNLVFIDEGHKGAGGNSENGWKTIREELAKDGFIFEYSATFGQIIEFTKTGKPKKGKTKQTNIELYNEYIKAIIFNYSYKYFYTDGYGKDFHVYNIKETKYMEEQKKLLLTAGLLSFYEQLIIFEENKESFKDYNIEKPLWIFIGNTVIKKKNNQPSKNERKTVSDVEEVILFLKECLENEDVLEENVKKILKGKSGLIGDDENDIFKDKFEYIKNKYENSNFKDIIKDIYEKVFGDRGKLEIYDIKNADGEIGLKISSSEKYFGVINVGDTNALKKLMSTSNNIEIKDDHFSQSQFFDIDKTNSHINILIGSKKFIEGWNSWRVSCMGLINMGKGEGPQIIQLFGRGVRLKGENYSLKREENPDYKIKMLQTLFIFGLNADYINQFLRTLGEEEVDFKEISIPIIFNMPNKWEKNIYTIKTKDDFDFLKYPIKLNLDNDLLKNIKIDLRPIITMSQKLKVKTINTSDKALEIPDNLFGNLLNIIDWNDIYLKAINYKVTEGFYNLAFDKETLKKIIKSKKYEIFIDQEIIKVDENSKNNESDKSDKSNVEPKFASFDSITKLQEIFLMVIKNYISKFYRREEKRKAMDNLEVKPLTREYKDMFPENREIILKIPKDIISDFANLLNQIEKYKNLIKQIKEDLIDKDKIDEIKNILKLDDFHTIYFDKHLYAPLLVYSKTWENIKSIPVKLNEGETKFVKDLKNYLSLDKNKNSLEKKDIFLLRNLSKRGVGFFINSGFYPDFIIWVIDNIDKNKQNIIFVDPKGIRNLGNFNDEKIQFCSPKTEDTSEDTSNTKNIINIKDIQKRVNEELKKENSKVDLILDAFIISVSPYDDIKDTFGEGKYSKKDFKPHNILFQEDNGYIETLFDKVFEEDKNKNTTDES